MFQSSMYPYFNVKDRDVSELLKMLRNDTRMPTLPTPIQCSPGIPSQRNKVRRRRNKRKTNR
jgi:hypothetical protein